MTALAWAAQDDHKQAVDMLLKAGANPDIQNKVYHDSIANFSIMFTIMYCLTFIVPSYSYK
jgi:ankyrin repeat protein